MLKGKRGLVMGLANHRSIAWAITKACHEQGAEVHVTYASERLGPGVEKLVQELDGVQAHACDVTKDEELDALFETLGEGGAGLDFLVHAIAYAEREDLARPFHETSREGFRIAHDISSYSFPAAAHRAAPLMARNGGGSMLTLTYNGAVKVAPGYNVMGVAKASLEASARYLAYELGPDAIRVNALSAGPIKTLAARGIRNFNDMLKHHRDHAPMRRDVEIEEVADAALFLLSPLGRGVTGQILFVDGGAHVL